MLGETPYEGTLSTLTKHGTMLTSRGLSSPKRERGKVRGNKRDPRTSAPSLTSDCVSYKRDADGNIVEARIFAPARKTRTTSTARTTVSRARLDTYLERLNKFGTSSDVD